MWRTLIGLLLAALVPGVAAAQAELSAVLGYRTGDSSFLVEADATGIACLVPPCVVAEARTPESEALTLVLDLPLRPGWMLEALLSRQDAGLELEAGLPPEAGPIAPESFELTIFQLGVSRRWQRDRLVPFVAVGIGIARAESSAAILSPPIEPAEPGRRLGAREGLSASVGGGVRRAIDSRWGLRFEARAYWSDLPAELGGDLVQTEVGVGLSAKL